MRFSYMINIQLNCNFSHFMMTDQFDDVYDNPWHIFPTREYWYQL